MDDCAKRRYNVIIVRYLLTSLGLNLEFLDHIVEADGGHLKGSTEPMFDLGAYKFKYLNTGKSTPEEYFMNSCIDEVHELEQLRTSTKRLRTILDAKYEKADLNKVLKNQRKHLIEEQCN